MHSLIYNYDMTVKYGVKDKMNIVNQSKNTKPEENFKGPREGAKNLQKESKIDKVRNIIIIVNCLFISDQLQKKLPDNFYFENPPASSQY